MDVFKRFPRKVLEAGLLDGFSMAAIPPVILYVILSKYVTKGIALGGITK